MNLLYLIVERFVLKVFFFNIQLPACTIFLRLELLKNHLNEGFPIWKMGDYPKWPYMPHEMRSYRPSNYTAVYRVLRGSASHSSNKQAMVDFKLSSIDSSFFIQIEKTVIKALGPSFQSTKEKLQIVR